MKTNGRLISGEFASAIAPPMSAKVVAIRILVP
jgi:hypothetical protein